jgi:putative membrane protein
MESRKEPDMHASRPDDSNVLKGLAAGAASGLLAAFVMNQFQGLLKKATQKNGDSGGEQHSADRGDGKSAEAERHQQEGEDATVKAAAKVSEGVFHHPLTAKEKKVAGPAVHYATGAAFGALYGALAELDTRTTLGAGVPFGTAVWLAADEVAVPALGLSAPPNRTPASTHAYAFASHAVYGLTTDLVRRGLRHVL